MHLRRIFHAHGRNYLPSLRRLRQLFLFEFRVEPPLSSGSLSSSNSTPRSLRACFPASTLKDGHSMPFLLPSRFIFDVSQFISDHFMFGDECSQSRDGHCVPTFVLSRFTFDISLFIFDRSRFGDECSQFNHGHSVPTFVLTRFTFYVSLLMFDHLLFGDSC